MTAETIRRTETFYIDEISRRGVISPQWFAEKRHATHPITHNNDLKIFMCGEESFADIAMQIKGAKQSIDLVCWGFDPGMELARDDSPTWPRGPTFGDLLIAAGKSGVQVRLLVWYDKLLSPAARNMPGISHGTDPWNRRARFSRIEGELGAQHSLAMLQENWREVPVFEFGRIVGPLSQEMIPLHAREQYCHSWYERGLKNGLACIEIRTRGTESNDIERSLATERHQPASLATLELERQGLVRGATHHQKTILIDFAFEEGRKAVGYVMGLNCVTDYWDSCAHKPDDPRREQASVPKRAQTAQGLQPEPGFTHLKPYHDYACRIDGGKALIALYNNFSPAWNDAIEHSGLNAAAKKCAIPDPPACKVPPANLLRKAMPGHSTVQILRTQPADGDKSIQEIYTLAASTACLASGYMYIENQYFQDQEWAQRLMQTRKEVIAKWQRGAANAGKTIKQMPLMHIFIVMPVPELSAMIPNTHDTLAAFGEQDALKGQSEMIEQANKNNKQHVTRDARGIPKYVSSLPEVVKHANRIKKRDIQMLENTFGVKVCTAMLETSAYSNGRWRYREIYIHSKLLLIDDVFLTLGSANLNQRSMAVDSELNIATNDPVLARELRKRVWLQHSGGMISGGNGTGREITKAFQDWRNQMISNKRQKSDGQPMTGFVIPLEDPRSSTLRLS